MRNRLVAMATVGLVCVLGATAQAGDILFDFEGTDMNPMGTGDSTAISAYMTEVYGDNVTLLHAQINPRSSGWPSTGDSYQNDTRFVQAMSGDGSNFRILFGDRGVTAVRFTGFIDDAAEDGADFQFLAFTNGFSEPYEANGFYFLAGIDNPNPDSRSANISWEADEIDPDGKTADVSFQSGWITFDTPVRLLIFDAAGPYRVAIDDLEVRPVPLPAAVWMGLVMLGGLGLARRGRKRTCA